VSLTKVVVMAVVMRVVRPSTLVGSASGRAVHIIELRVLVVIAVDIILVVMHHQCVCSGIGKSRRSLSMTCIAWEVNIRLLKYQMPRGSCLLWIGSQWDVSEYILCEPYM